VSSTYLLSPEGGQLFLLHDLQQSLLHRLTNNNLKNRTNFNVKVKQLKRMEKVTMY
jgi:hypothetical protein